MEKKGEESGSDLRKHTRVSKAHHALPGAVDGGKKVSKEKCGLFGNPLA